jgi:hypothetical protein
MPYRSLYSRDVANLFLAGRLASVTHLGLGSWRLQRTLSGGGQAVGVAAALCKRHGCDNRAIHDQHLTELQQTLLREDGAILHVPADDPSDLARRATVRASSESRHGVTKLDDWLPLDQVRGVQLWDWSPRLGTVALYLMNQNDTPAELTLTVEQHLPERPWRDDQAFQRFAYEPVANRMEWGSDNRRALFAAVATATATAAASSVSWVTFDVGRDLAPGDPASDEPRVNLLLHGCDGVSWARSRRRYDFARRLHLEPGADRYGSDGDSCLFRLDPAPAYGEAANVINGWNRRFSTNPLNAWQADPDADGPAWLELAWHEPIAAAAVRLTFDTITRAYREMPYDSEQRVSPMCVRDYLIERCEAGRWSTVAQVRDNYHRHRVHELAAAAVSALRITVLRVWDERLPARIYEVRVEA